MYWAEQVTVAPAPEARGSIDADVVVIGGGIAGLSAARRLGELGQDVVLLEAQVCGAGATGRSSGFVTPDSELELCHLEARFGAADASLLWRAALGACARLRADVERWRLAADLVPADSLFVARTSRSSRLVRAEHEAHQRLGLPSRHYDREQLAEVLGGDGFCAGVRAPSTFGMNGFAYAQGLKQALVAEGVRCFEGSPVVAIAPHEVRTPEAIVRARAVLVCLDRFALDLGLMADDCYHAQAFLILSEPLDDATWRAIFPDAPLLVWDSDLVYQYFRRTGEGRLLVGGGRLAETYAAREHPSSPAHAKLERYARRCFAALAEVRFTHRWQGLIGMSKDLLPIAGRCPGEPWKYVALCAAGLPWSVLAGESAAAQLAGGATPLDRFFVPGRRFHRIERLQPLLGKPLTWALSYYFARRSGARPSSR